MSIYIGIVGEFITIVGTQAKVLLNCFFIRVSQGGRIAPSVLHIVLRIEGI